MGPSPWYATCNRSIVLRAKTLFVSLPPTVSGPGRVAWKRTHVCKMRQCKLPASVPLCAGDHGVSGGDTIGYRCRLTERRSEKERADGGIPLALPGVSTHRLDLMVRSPRRCSDARGRVRADEEDGRLDFAGRFAMAMARPLRGEGVADGGEGEGLLGDSEWGRGF